MKVSSHAHSSIDQAVAHPSKIAEPGLHSLEMSLVKTVAYADIYDYPLRVEEAWRYLIGIPASLEEVRQALSGGTIIGQLISQSQGYLTLHGREGLAELRRERERESNRLWPLAIHYGRLMAHLPFIRMVAVTGALAMDNVNHRRDIDYLVITQEGRLWLCRAMVILLVRWAANRGIALCPNYFLSENALSLRQRDLYTAHELIQMVPLFGSGTYGRFRRLNRWTEDHLPNARGMDPPKLANIKLSPHGQQLAIESPLRTHIEKMLRSPLGDWLEAWEMNRKVRKLSAVQPPQNGREEAQFSPQWCKGHFDGHAVRALKEYSSRLQRIAGFPV